MGVNIRTTTKDQRRPYRHSAPDCVATAGGGGVIDAGHRGRERAMHHVASARATMLQARSLATTPGETTEIPVHNC